MCRRGLRVLERGFDRRHGWEGAGAPRQLLRLDNLPAAVAARMNTAEMLRCNCWDSVGAAGDQGFFIYNYLVLHEAKTFAAAGPYTPWASQWPLSQRWVVHHFFYAHKPWAPWARCPEYFDFLGARGDGAQTSRCHAILAEKKRCLGRQGPHTEATCKACAAQSTHSDAESKVQLQWACRQPPACPKPWDIEWQIF